MYGFEYPLPPTEALMPQTMQFVLTIVFGAISLIWIAYAIWQAVCRRAFVPLYIVIGGAIAILYEPVGDALELAYYPPVGQTTWIHLFGRQVPLFIGVSFFSYFGMAVWAFMALRRKGFTPAVWWGFFFGLAAMRVVQDEFILSFGQAWIYYGPHPFQYRYFPLWVAFPTAAFQVVVGAGICAIVDKMPARSHWMVIPAVPLLFLSGHACAVFPATLALYNTSSPALLQFGAVASVVLSCLIVWAVGQWFTVPATKLGRAAVRA